MNSLGPWEKNMRNLSENQKVTPPDMIWKNVDAAINKEKKRRFLIFWVAALGLLGLGAVSYYLLKHDANITVKQSLESKEAISSNTGITETNSAIDKTNSTPENKVLIEEEIKRTNDIATITNSDKNNTSSIPTKNTKYKGPTKNKTQVITSSKSGKIKADLRNDRTTGTELAINSINLSEGQTLNNTNSISTENNANTVNPELIDSKEKYIVDQLYSFPTKQAYLNYKIRPISGVNHDESCPAFNKKNTINFFLEAEGNIGLSNKQLIAVSDDYKQLMSNRTNSEESWYTWGAGFHAGLIFNDKWSITSGINYTQIKEKFITTRPGYTKIVIIVDTTKYPNIFDTTVVTGTLINKIENRYSFIDIPITLGYEHKFNNWGIAIEGGINFNISLKTKGKIYDGSKNIQTLEEHEDIYKSSLGLGYHVAFTLHRYLSDRTSVYIRPQFKSYFNDWSTDTYPLKASYSVIGLNLGIRHKF